MLRRGLCRYVQLDAGKKFGPRESDNTKVVNAEIRLDS